MTIRLITSAFTGFSDGLLQTVDLRCTFWFYALPIGQVIILGPVESYSAMHVYSELGITAPYARSFFNFQREKLAEKNTRENVEKAWENNDEKWGTWENSIFFTEFQSMWLESLTRPRSWRGFAGTPPGSAQTRGQFRDTRGLAGPALNFQARQKKTGSGFKGSEKD